jgi:imidazolonepropionase-like amidohydrolase
MHATASRATIRFLVGSNRRATNVVLWTIIAVALTVSSTSYADESQPTTTDILVGTSQINMKAATTVLTGATIIDGNGGGPVENMVIGIAGEHIVYLGDVAGVKLAPRGTVVDLSGHWITPGFVDMHGHLAVSDAGATAYLARLVAFGTTTLRDPANPKITLRERVRSGALLGPQLFVSGKLINGMDAAFGELVGTEGEIREVVRQQAAEGVNFIKLYVGLSPNLVSAAIDEAHRHDLGVIGHLGQTTWTEAAEMGIDALTHSWYAGLAHSVVPKQYQAEFRDFYIPNGRFNPALFRKWREVVVPTGPEVTQLAALLAQRNIVVDPNLVHGEAVTWGDDPLVLERLEPEFAGPELAEKWRAGRHPYSASWQPDAMTEAKLAFPIMSQIIRVFHERGVLLTVGTDYANPWMTPGVAYHRELELLVAAGIPPLDVLRIATRNGAEALNILGEAGTIEVGKRADLLVLSADPLAAIANTRRIRYVFLRGKSVEPAQLLSIR